MRENKALEDEVALYRVAWNEAVLLAEKVTQAITIIKRGLITVEASVARAEKDWLAFGGGFEGACG